MNKKILTKSVQNPAFLKFSELFESIDSRRTNLVRVLTYHWIEDALGFEQQMEFLSQKSHVLSMPEFEDGIFGRAALPPQSVVITFDDAYQNFEECAWPILKSYSLPACLFVPTAFPDHNTMVFWWDRLEHALLHTNTKEALRTPFGRLPIQTGEQRSKAFKRLRVYVKTLPHQEALAFVDQICAELNTGTPEAKVLGWDALRRLASEGVVLGAHTQTHPLLNHIPAAQARAEIAGSLQDLQREIGASSHIFAYPDGQYTREVVQAVKEAGIRLAFTTQRGSIDIHHADHFHLRRNNIGRQATQPVLRARLLQATIYLDRFRPIPSH